ncbi:MAG: TIGR02450 family Trp-rich protein [Gomphosphaeria aponina SAG 52.96 = DSM 107014]|uniref:TIGR02450 family Trp-rich protein n=1 Tax=Gomphosphaeria aponina SAG 52.96 = DSM 107014 TaxID=1521640 RepID=A0A941GVQ4_9CHRO|nr:TIGR02450 family Trp-rich protein [Gomphosphaeria aponina SAG 52.96 = DSM 107014]
MPKKQKYPRLLGSKWTSLEKTWGWRHFQVVNRKTQGKWVFAEMVASCDPSVRFWLNAQQLDDPSFWKAGWLPLQELSQADTEDNCWFFE